MMIGSGRQSGSASAHGCLNAASVIRNMRANEGMGGQGRERGIDGVDGFV